MAAGFKVPKTCVGAAAQCQQLLPDFRDVPRPLPDLPGPVRNRASPRVLHAVAATGARGPEG